jgi:23S rRNA (cytosine1962-C5)-methyltransferase
MIDQPLSSKALETLLATAWQKRVDLHADETTNLYRLVHGFGDGLPGLNIDKVGDCAVIWEQRIDAYDIEAVSAWLKREMAPSVILHKGPRFRDQDAGGVCLHGELKSDELRVVELGLHYSLEPLAAQNLGIFIDARPVREWLKSNSSGRHILNTFAYTGSLGVAARSGGATSCVHVDLQRAQLQRARINHALNDQALDDRDLVRADCLRLLAKTKRNYGGIILDPPPRLPGKRKGDPQAWRNLVRRAAPLLAEDGWLLCLLNRRGLSREHWQARIIEAAAEVDVDFELFYNATSGEDFAEPDEGARLRIAAFRRGGV